MKVKTTPDPVVFHCMEKLFKITTRHLCSTETRKNRQNVHIWMNYPFKGSRSSNKTLGIVRNIYWNITS